MLYYLYELNHAAVAPWRTMAGISRNFWNNTANPWAQTRAGRSIAASLDMFERATRRYGKPEFAITSTTLKGQPVAVSEERVWTRPFCRLLHFRREVAGRVVAKQPKVLIVAPMSGHYATLLRGTVEDMLPHGDVYITDWRDARNVPLAEGRFDLDDFIDYIIDMLAFLGPDTHVMAVCQPSVPVLAAVAVMSARGDANTPRSMTLMGGPVDTRINPTAVNDLAVERGVDWFARNVIVKVPFPHAGFMRDVYPGFLQLTGFMTMNLDRHLSAHRELFTHLIEGDGLSAEKHREFYDEYLSVMDLTAEFYLQTVAKVFVEHALPRGEFDHRGEIIDPAAITKTALMTVEGERDDISGVGQTQAAHDLCRNIPAAKRAHHLQAGVGHYGVFNGRRFREQIVPEILSFMDRAG